MIAYGNVEDAVREIKKCNSEKDVKDVVMNIDRMYNECLIDLSNEDWQKLTQAVSKWKKDNMK